MKKETKEFARLFGIALIVMLAVPLAYRICIYFWPPDEKPRQTLTQFVEEAKSERSAKLLTKPIAKWTDGPQAWTALVALSLSGWSAQ